MNNQKHDLAETLDELHGAIETSNRDCALTCLGYLRRLLLAPVPDIPTSTDLFRAHASRCTALACAYNGVAQRLIFEPKRGRQIVADTRHLAMHLSLSFAPRGSLRFVAAYFQRSYSGVQHALNAVQSRRLTEPEFAAAITRLLAQAKAASPVAQAAQPAVSQVANLQPAPGQGTLRLRASAPLR